MAHIHQARNDLEKKLEQAKAQRKQEYRDSTESIRKSDKRWLIGCIIFLAVCVIGFIWLVRDIEIGLTVRAWVGEKLNDASDYLTTAQWGGDWLENKFGRGFFTVVFDIIIYLILLIPKLLLLLLALVGEFVLPSVARITLYVLPLVLGVVDLIVIFILISDNQYGGTESDEEQIIRAGLEGEQTALKLMKRLNNNCHVYTNLRIPYDGGESETDLIVVSPAGVTVIEVKNYKGTITGNASADNLTQVKSRHGDSKTVQNPIRQVGTHVYRLAGYLRSKGIRTYVRNCVLFVNDNVTVQLDDPEGVTSDKCPVFTAATIQQLYDYVSSGETVLNDVFLRRTVETLNALVDSSFAQDGAPAAPVEAPSPTAPTKSNPRYPSRKAVSAPADDPAPTTPAHTDPAPAEPAYTAIPQAPQAPAGGDSDGPIVGSLENNSEAQLTESFYK